MPHKPTIPLVCKQCGEPFTVELSRRDTARFCSRACRAEGQRLPLAKRFWEKVDQSASDGCWPWLGARQWTGHGIVRVDGKNVRAHRVAYELTFGPIPEGLVICHICDRGECCNPMHLWAGTQQENMEDKVRKGRARGARRKLSTEQVREIRRRYAAGGIRQWQLAKEYGVGRPVINTIVHRKERVRE